MSSAYRSEYDRGVNTFSPEGRLFQVEYAIEAIKVSLKLRESCLAPLIDGQFKLGSTAVGIQTAEGVVLAVEKRVTSTLLEPSSIEKIMEIDQHLGCAMSGLTADSRTMIDHARVEAQVRALQDYDQRQGNISTRILIEPLVHLQRADHGGKRHAGRMRPGIAIWRECHI